VLRTALHVLLSVARVLLQSARVLLPGAGVLLLGGVLVTGDLQAGEEPAPFLPVLQLPTIAGDVVATSDFRGKPLLLVEFASW